MTSDELRDAAHEEREQPRELVRGFFAELATDAELRAVMADELRALGYVVREPDRSA